VNRPTALAVIGGDDVYEDLFTAAGQLAGLAAEAGLATRPSMGTARVARAAEHDLVLLYTAMGSFPEPAQVALAEAVRAGTGLVAVHSANVFPDQGGYESVHGLIGSRYVSHGPAPHESRFTVRTDREHPLTRGLGDFEIAHEHYHLELRTDVRVVAWRDAEPVVHVRREGRGRVAYVQLGHDMRVWADPKARALMTRCIEWAVGAQPPGAGQ